MNEAVTSLSGVGDKVAKLLAKLGIETIGDLVMHVPRRYDDYSKITPVGDIQPGPVTAQVRIGSVTGRYVRRGLHITEAILTDESGSVKAVWFNQPYRAKQLVKGQEYFVSGTYDFNNRSYSLLNPSMEKVSDFPKNTARIVPIYPETKGLKSHTLRKLVSKVAFDELTFDTALPFEEQMGEGEALQLLHFPQSAEDIEKGKRFLAFRELFSIVLAAEMVRRENDSFAAEPTPFDETTVSAFVSSLPFALTNDQRKVAWKCITEMEGSRPMNRLVEGDVGSGKTLVAAIVALNAVKAKQQVAIMVPTEVLAQQHFDSLTKLLEPYGVRVALYTGSLKKTDKQAIADQAKQHKVDILVGTHALIQESIDYAHLNLVVIDEQHRFGVNQRIKLLNKSKQLPHVLTMTATPIPRTLALTVFGDLDISIIAEMPKGRKPIETSLASPNSMKQVYTQILSEVSAGRQAFVIYPLVEESETLAAKSATEAHEKLSKGPLKDVRVGLLHGRMKSEEKDAVMREFAAGMIDVLVSTTVIEVGVDVPNASIIVIEGAERFGLAQIHQLRGRVGRGEHQSYCILVPSTSQQVSQRLRALETIADGFRLAEYDLELRGPGAIYGSAQHGQLDVRFTSFDNVEDIAHAKEQAAAFLDDGEELLHYPRLAAWVEQYKAITHLN